MITRTPGSICWQKRTPLDILAHGDVTFSIANSVCCMIYGWWICRPLTLPDSIKGRLCGAPLSTSLTLQKHRLDYFIHLISAFLDWKVFSCFFGHFQRWSKHYLYPDYLACHGGGTSCQHTLCRGQDLSFPERDREWVHRGNTGSDPSIVMCQGHAGLSYLQTDGQVNPGPKRSADSSGGKPHVFKQLREGMREGETRTLLCYHHAAPHARKVHSTGLKHRNTTWLIPGEIFCRQLCCSERRVYTVPKSSMWEHMYRKTSISVWVFLADTILPACRTLQRQLIFRTLSLPSVTQSESPVL